MSRLQHVADTALFYSKFAGITAIVVVLTPFAMVLDGVYIALRHSTDGVDYVRNAAIDYLEQVRGGN